MKVLEVKPADSGAAFYKGASWLRSVGVEGWGQKAIYVKLAQTGQWVANVYSQ